MFPHSARYRNVAGAALLTLCVGGSAIAASLLKVDAAKSSIGAVFKQMNVPVEGKFKQFNAQVTFDAAHPEAAKANVDIDIAGFDLGDPDFNKEVLKREWFNAAQFPKASFVSSVIKPAAGGVLDVSGKLTIKGKSIDVRFPLTLKKQGSNQVFDGALPIKRLAFNIGEGEWKDTATVADEVVIKFHLVTAQ
jgi:polyisoprenoid-binding protein YceI